MHSAKIGAEAFAPGFFAAWFGERGLLTASETEIHFTLRCAQF